MQIAIDPRGDLPPSEQIAQQVRFAVAAGLLEPGERLPSVRTLAVEALVNPNTVGKAWREFQREGVLEARSGDGVFVARDALEKCTAARDSALRERLERWVADALSAGLSREELAAWTERALAPGRPWKRIGGRR